MIKIFCIVVAVVLTVTSSVQATVTLSFGQTGVARASGFADASGTPTNGMRWGIVISTTNTTFEPTSQYDPIANLNVSGFLTKNQGAVITDDYYFAHPSSLTTSTSTSTNGDPGGVGSITSITSVPFGTNSISLSDPFAIIWFPVTPADGSAYGLFENPNFTMPADGSNISYAATVFGGTTADPAKAASFQFSAVPEPSHAVLAFFGMASFLFRRRRH